MASLRVPLASCITCSPNKTTSEQLTEPCCDETCLDAIARQQCALQCGGDGVLSRSCNPDKIAKCHDSISSDGSFTKEIEEGEVGTHLLSTPTRKRKYEACNTHSHSVRERFATVLSRVGCICTELLADGLEPCCRMPGSRLNTAAAVAKSNSSPNLRKLKAPEDCGTRGSCGISEDSCPTKTDGCSDSERTPGCSGAKSKINRCSSTAKNLCSDQEICCGRNSNEIDGTIVKEFDNYVNEALEKATCSGKSCCDAARKEIPAVPLDALPCGGSGRSDLDLLSKSVHGEDPNSCNQDVKSLCSKVDEKVTMDRDLEKGTVVLEHVVLDVQGLTCVGCETKLSKSLRAMSGVHNLHTSLVLSRAEFDLDGTAIPAVEIIQSVEKTTGFACQRLNQEGQELVVLVDGNAKAFTERRYLDGVTQMIFTDKKTVRITYDPRVVGARVLLEQCSDTPLTLAAPRGSSDIETGKNHVQNMARTTLVSACLTLPVLVLAWAPIPPHSVAYGSTSLALATIVQFAIAGPFYPSALRALVFTHVIEMDLLIVLSTSTAYIFSVVSFAYEVVGRPLPTGQFFETSTLLVTLIMLGRFVSAFARQRAVESVSIRSLQQATAVLCDIDGRGDQEIDARLLQYGDLFKVTPDSRITTDGVIVSGSTETDESMITGEAIPVEKSHGSSVVAGSLNGSGVIIVRLTHLPGHNTISTIAAMVDEAKFSKPKTQELVDIIASYFVPVILILTVITFAVWTAIGMSVRHQNGGHATASAVTYAISVLIVSCPCAIGLAVPMVVVISGGVAAKHGVVFKSAMAIETARKVSHIVFDKTGTLTQGELSVMEEVYLPTGLDSAASVALGLTKDSKHPVSLAISTYLKAKGVCPAKIEGSKSVTGKGVEGTFEGASIRCGNAHWLSAESQTEVQDLLVKGLTVCCVTMNEQMIATFGLSDSLRPDAHSVVTELQKRKIAVSILSGDGAGPVNAVAAQLGIPATHVRSRCTPGQKQDYLKNLKANERQIVLFCGDGTNDAVALAQADIGVHLNSGSDVAQNAAEAVLMRPYLSGILVLLDLSKAAFCRILFNFAWSFVYNFFAISLAAGAFVKARIPPQYAGLGEIVSVLPVVLIALQLRWFKPDH